MRKNRAISKANKLSPSRQRVLAFERLGTRALLSATPIQPMLDDSAVQDYADAAASTLSQQPLTPVLAVRNVVEEINYRGWNPVPTESGYGPGFPVTEFIRSGYPTYVVTVDGIVDVSVLPDNTAWQYCVQPPCSVPTTPGVAFNCPPESEWQSLSRESFTLPAIGPIELRIRQTPAPGDVSGPVVSTIRVLVDPNWNKKIYAWSGTIPDSFHSWYSSRHLFGEQRSGGRVFGVMEVNWRAPDLRNYFSGDGLTVGDGVTVKNGLSIDSDTYWEFIGFLPKTQRDRLVPTGRLNELGKPQKALIPKGSPILLNGKLLSGEEPVTLAEITASLEVFAQEDINGDGSVAGRPASVGGVRVDATIAQMSEELAGDTQLVVYSARGIPGVTGRVYMVGESGLTADNTYDAGDLEDYKVLRLSNGKPIAAPTVPVALRPNASGVEVLFSLGTASPTYQSRVFSLQSGRAIGKPSVVFRDVGVLEAEYATDLNGDQVIGNAITIAQVLDPSNLEPDANDEASIGVYRVSGVAGVTGSVVAVGDANLQSGQTYVDADLARMTVLRGTNGKPLSAGFTPVAVRDDGAQVEVLFKPSPSSSVHQTQRFNATSGRAIGRPSKPVQNLVSIEGVFAQDLNVDGVIGAAFTVTSVVDDSGAMAGGGPGNYGLYWVAGLRQGPSLVVSDRGLVAGEVYQEGDVGTTIELVSRKGAPLASGFPAVAISESGDTVDVLYRAGAAYQTQRFNIASGRAVGVAGPVRSDVASLEDEFDQDLNDDGTVG